MEYKFKTEKEIKNCIECPFFRAEVYYCKLSYDVKIDYKSIPTNCPLQKVEEVYENKCCNTCDNQKCEATEEPCLSCCNHPTEWVNWKKRSEI